MADALRTGRKKTPIHPVKVIRADGTTFTMKPRKRDKPHPRRQPRARRTPPSFAPTFLGALAQLKQAARDDDLQRVAALERHIDKLVGSP